MNNYNVLVLAEMTEELLVRLINNYQGFTATSINKASEVYTADLSNYQIILIGGGISDVEIDQIRQFISIKNHKIRIIEHYGGGSGLLKQELFSTINQIETNYYETKN